MPPREEFFVLRDTIDAMHDSRLEQVVKTKRGFVDSERNKPAVRQGA